MPDARGSLEDRVTVKDGVADDTRPTEEASNGRQPEQEWAVLPISYGRRQYPVPWSTCRLGPPRAVPLAAPELSRPPAREVRRLP